MTSSVTSNATMLQNDQNTLFQTWDKFCNERSVGIPLAKFKNSAAPAPIVEQCQSIIRRTEWASKEALTQFIKIIAFMIEFHRKTKILAENNDFIIRIDPSLKDLREKNPQQLTKLKELEHEIQYFEKILPTLFFITMLRDLKNEATVGEINDFISYLKSK